MSCQGLEPSRRRDSQYGLHPGGVAIQVALVLGTLALLWVARRRISAA